jgi:lipoprotein-releasing system permease protein
VPELGRTLWELLGAAGGGFALGFIVVIAAGLLLGALLFAAAAAVLLERFARMARRPVFVAGAAVGWWWLLELVLHELGPELAFEAGQLSRLGLAAGVSALLALLVVGLTWLGIRRLRSRTLARVGLAAVGLGLPLVIAASVAPTSLVARTGGLLGAALLAFLGAAILLGVVPLAIAGFLDVRGSTEWFIAVRYLFAKRRQTFISIITAICVGGVAAGVWLIITVLSVMNGFERTWRDEIIGNRAHFTVHNRFGPFENYEEVLTKVLAIRGVVAASPYLDAEGMVRGERGEILGVRVRGVDPRRVADVTDLKEDLVAGSLEALDGGASGGGGSEDPGIIVGSELANVLGLELGHSLLLVSPFGGPPTPLGPAPRLARFRVAGIFQTSFFQYDEVYTFVSLSAAQAFRRSGDVVDGIEVRTPDFYRSRRVAELVQEVIAFPFYTRDWKEFFPAFFQALKTERVMMFVLLTMIMVVAAFAIVVTLVMMIMEKSSDIAILKAMGAEDASIERIFAIEGALIGLLGTVLGVVAGIAVTTRLDWIQRTIEALTGIDTLPASVYQLSTLPSELNAVQIAAVVGIAMGLALGATWLPSRQGARLDPAEALRYE